MNVVQQTIKRVRLNEMGTLSLFKHVFHLLVDLISRATAPVYLGPIRKLPENFQDRVIRPAISDNEKILLAATLLHRSREVDVCPPEFLYGYLQRRI
jgi:hypothetical protein